MDQRHLTPQAMRLRPRFNAGVLCVASSVVITLLIWLSWRIFVEPYEDPWKYGAKVGSLTATLLICWTFVLAARWPILEGLFDGLDKVYETHAKIGKCAFFIIWLHPLFLAAHRLPDIGAYFGYFSEGGALRITGLMALVLMTVLVAVTLWNRLRYHHWKATHSWFGAVMLLVIIHAILADGDIARNPFLRAWFTGWFFAAGASFLYLKLFYPQHGPRFRYRVHEARQATKDIFEFDLRPTNPHQMMTRRPSQFAYLAFDTPGLPSEMHPYTISSAPGSEHLRFSIKQLGDYTRQLGKVRVGDTAWLWGPYGKFSDHFFEYYEYDAVLIAGGIGITPFLSLIEDPLFQKNDLRHTWLFYGMREDTDAYYHEKIQGLDMDNDRLIYHPRVESKDGFLNVDFIETKVGTLDDKVFFFCGPPGMRNAILKQLASKNIPRDRIFFENFSFV